MTSFIAASSVEAPGQQFASRRLYCLVSLSLSVTTLLMLIALLPVVPEQAHIVGSLYSIVAIALVSLPAIVTMFLFRTTGIRTLRAVWRMQASAMLLLYAVMPFTLVTGQIPRGPNSLWMFEMETVAGCAAVLSWRVRPLILYIGALQVILFTVAIFFGEGSVSGPVVGDAVRSLITTALFSALAVALMRAGHLLDATVDAAIAESTGTARVEVARAGQRTVQMLVHDRIIVALLAYATGADADRAAAEARSALMSIRATPGRVADREGLTPRRLAWDMQALTTALDPRIRFEYSVEGEDPIPATASAAVIEALSEAIRNSIRHTREGHAVSREVRATITSDHLDVVILDDGVGFDTASIGPARLGIRHGIIRRLTSVAGGGAEVRSRIGYGTVVSLHWRRP
ncbi:MAG: hypothetical protein JST33_11975 [Actinobacteria bacterium]|nr:hypothetical protein [Actinomycetota bacterium]